MGSQEAQNFLSDSKADKTPKKALISGSNPEQTTVRSGEEPQLRNQSPEVRLTYSHLKKLASQMQRNPTFTESLLNQTLKKENIRYKFQKVIPPYIVDFWFPKCNLIVELDGCHHNFKISYDLGRDEFISSLGLKVLRFNNKEKTDNILLAIKECLKYKVNNNSIQKLTQHINCYNNNYSFGLTPHKLKIFERKFRRTLQYHLDRIWWFRYNTYKPGMDWQTGKINNG